MRIRSFFWVGVSIFLLSESSTAASGLNTTEIISCSLPGKLTRKVLFTIDNETQALNYTFKKDGKVELIVHFDAENKLKRLVDSKMGVTYYGFNRGKYSYVIDIINGAEKEEYTMSFDVKKDDKIVQSDDCLPSSFRNKNIESKFITEIPYTDDDGMVFP
ncbi:MULTISPECIES: hypothetical protein [Enterobacter cloacae complex]|uniref:hypothetical protein n=1 Tax=Enterobacter cloacae complex TaxID=354276 RepID=UPI00097BD082|nr:hypothetical protein [Enterobacter chengduensis]GJL41731.1 hypothetical protein TUM17577_29400 [Enterobacter asburiae]MBT1935467.1 hypothetical protein [Enterobacter chengduensis]MBT1963949.1 hypothetical protein [Enterobacter chengduensis]MCK6820267.1 hypothetical protein [Enterobacter chengduensis]MCK7170806.1 hypothetical protein [Enterobacter chengduensis]